MSHATRGADARPTATWRVSLCQRLFPSYVSTNPVARSGVFQNLMFLFVVACCVLAAIRDPRDPQCRARHCRNIRIADAVFTVVFLVESILAYVCLGGPVFRKEPLRLLDCFITAANIALLSSAAVGAIPVDISLNVLRAGRLISPLFTTIRFRALCVLIVSLNRCLLQLADIVLLYVLFLLWFSIAGVYQFGGSLKSRCVATEYFNQTFMQHNRLVRNYNLTSITDFVCGGRFDTLSRHALSHEGKTFCTPFQTCDVDPSTVLVGYRCPWGFECTEVEMVFDGHFGFDNLLQAMLTTFTCVTRQAWFTLMHAAHDATDVLAVGYFVTLVVGGTYLITPLIPIVVMIELEKGKHEERERIREMIAQQQDDDGKLTVANVVQRLIIVQRKKDLEAHQLERPDLPHVRRAAKRAKAKSASMAAAWRQSTSTRRRDRSQSAVSEAPGPRHRDSLSEPLVLPMDVESDEEDHQRVELKVVNEENLPVWQWFLKDKVVDTWGFNYLTVLVILANIVALAYDHYEMSSADAQILSRLNLAFSIYFTTEAVLRFFSNTPRAYIMDFHNVFDVFIVVLSWVEILVARVNIPWIRALRALRCIKLLKNYPSLYSWLTYIANATRTAPLLVLLIVLLSFVFSCLGLQLYSQQFCGLESAPSFTSTNGSQCHGLPRANFDSFGHALISSFVVVSADGWDTVMRHAMTARGPAHALIFCAVFFIGHYIIIGLLIAVLLSANAEHDFVEQDEEGGSSLLHATAASTTSRFAPSESLASAGACEQPGHPPVNEQGKSAGPPDSSLTDILPSSSLSSSCASFSNCMAGVIESRQATVFFAVVILIGSLAMGFEDPISAPDSIRARTLFYVDVATTCLYCVEMLMSVAAYGCIIDPTSYLRRDHWNKFDFLLVILSVAGVSLAGVDQTSTITYLRTFRALRPLRLLRKSPGMKLVLTSLLSSVRHMRNVALIFAMILVTSGLFGVFLFKGSLRVCLLDDQYLPELAQANCTEVGGRFINDGPNFDNIGSSIVSLFIITTLEGWASITFRVMDSQGPGMPRLRNASPWSSLFTILMALFLGMFLANLFASALIDAFNRKKRTLLQLGSLREAQEVDGWVLTNKRILRHLSFEHQRRLRRPGEAGTISPPSPVNLLAPVLDAASSQAPAAVQTTIDTHSTARSGAPAISSDDDNEELLTQQSAAAGVETHSADASSTRIDAARAAVQRLLRHPAALATTGLLIFANFAVMAAEHYPRSKRTGGVLRGFSIGFSSIFVAEALLKIFGERWALYIQSKWNRLDLFVAVVSVVGVIVEATYNSQASALMRATLVLRLARVARGRLEIDSLLSKLAQALVSLVYVLAISVILFYVFAIFGMKLFGLSKWGPSGGAGGIDRRTNFATLASAMLTLLRLMNGGDWPELMYSVSQHPPFCSRQLNDCGPPIWATTLYFVVFIIVSLFVLKNIVMAVLLESFASSGRNTAIGKDVAALFVKQWRLLDPKESLEIRAFDVLFFLRSLPPKCALGFTRLHSKARVNQELRFLRALRLTDVKQIVRFESVVDELCRFRFSRAPAPPAARVFQRPNDLEPPEHVSEDREREIAAHLMLDASLRRLKRKLVQLPPQSQVLRGSTVSDQSAPFPAASAVQAAGSEEQPILLPPRSYDVHIEGLDDLDEELVLRPPPPFSDSLPAVGSDRIEDDDVSNVGDFSDI